MRLWVWGCLAYLALGGCGDDSGGAEGIKGKNELTVTLPPAEPSEAAGNELAAADAPSEAVAPQAGFETVAVVEPKAKAPAPIKREPAPVPAEAEDETPAQVEVAVAPSEETGAAAPAAAMVPPVRTGNWGAYLRRARFACGRVASVQPVQREGARAGYRYYRVECEGGGTYQATDKNGHLFFRRWQG